MREEWWVVRKALQMAGWRAEPSADKRVAQMAEHSAVESAVLWAEQKVAWMAVQLAVRKVVHSAELKAEQKAALSEYSRVDNWAGH